MKLGFDFEGFKKYNRGHEFRKKDYDQKTGNITIFHTTIKPIFRFIKHYFIQLGILDGYVGFIISFYQAKAVKMRYKYLKDLRNAE